MKTLVCISKAPDTTAKIAFKDNNAKFNEDGVQYVVNPYDEWYALVRALELKETLGGTVTIITVGLAESEAVIRKALAIGADESIRIDMEPTDSYQVAEQIANYAKAQNFDIIFAGKETINYNGSATGAMIAEFLDLPFISLASKLEMNGNTANVEIDIEGGVELLEVNTPFVISAQKGMAEARIPNMRGIMAARTKPITVVAPVASNSLTEVKSYALTQGRTECKFIDPNNMDELVNLLHNTAKVI